MASPKPQTDVAHDDDGWTPTPPEDMIFARRIGDDGAEHQVEYRELRKGDIFRPYSAILNGYVHPFDHELNDQAYALAIAEPIRGWHGQNGWQVEIECGSLDEMRELRIGMLS